MARKIKAVYKDVRTGITVDWDGSHWIVGGKRKFSDPKRADKAWEKMCEEAGPRVGEPERKIAKRSAPKPRTRKVAPAAMTQATLFG